MQYTIAKFYRIDGGSTQLKGVAPDVTAHTWKRRSGESREDNATVGSNQASAYDTFSYLDSAEIQSLNKNARSV